MCTVVIQLAGVVADVAKNSSGTLKLGSGYLRASEAMETTKSYNIYINN